MLFRANPLTSFISDQLPKLRATLNDLEQVLDKRLDAVNIADGSISTVLIADGAVTPAKIADGVGKIASGTYVGTGVANVIVSVGFIPRRVEVWKQSTAMTFHAIGSGSAAYSNFMRDSAGVLTTAAAEFQGIDITGSGGFKLGAAAGGGLSNTLGVTFWWIAER